METKRRYWEIWGDAEHAAQAFKLLGILSAIVALVLGVLAYRLANKPPLVILSSANGTAVLASAVVGRPVSFHRDVAVAFTQRLLTYGPKTYRDSVLSAARLLEPNSSPAFVQRLMNAESRYVANGTVQSFTLNDVSIKPSGAGATALVHGILTTSEAGRVSTEAVSFEVTTTPVEPSEENPYGVAVASFKKVPR